MSKIVATEFMSLDGVIDSPGGDNDFARGAWTFKFSDPEGMQFKIDETMNCDAQLLGRKTYEGFAAAWPGREGEFADRFNSMRKYVVSQTLEQDALTWENSTLISGDVLAEIAKLREQPGGDIVIHGSAALVRSLLGHGLIDELRLMVFPIVLGMGEKLFGDTEDSIVLQLADSKVLASGTVILTYRPA
ncbi:MAG TPA: dihydrofolate reductase family protein [Solirubrobacteraceae bacterium]|jgi:dihydrofolate reductase|nr:dihydrofolate reductase family protein [Solirubrobacteraceae bacterium]